MNNFDAIAPFYDRIARVVFWGSIESATARYVTEVSEEDSVLIIGGGTGKMLEYLPSVSATVFLEKSEKMIRKAKKRKTLNRVEFVRDDLLTVQNTARYQVIICPFILDCFNSENLELAIRKIKTLLAPGGKLIVVDFQGKSGFLIHLMHLFFRLFAALESKRLKNIHRYILQNHFIVEKEEFFHKNMIFSRVYRNL